MNKLMNTSLNEITTNIFEYVLKQPKTQEEISNVLLKNILEDEDAIEKLAGVLQKKISDQYIEMIKEKTLINNEAIYANLGSLLAGSKKFEKIYSSENKNIELIQTDKHLILRNERKDNYNNIVVDLYLYENKNNIKKDIMLKYLKETIDNICNNTDENFKCSYIKKGHNFISFSNIHAKCIKVKKFPLDNKLEFTFIKPCKAFYFSRRIASAPYEMSFYEYTITLPYDIVSDDFDVKKEFAEILSELIIPMACYPNSMGFTIKKDYNSYSTKSDVINYINIIQDRTLKLGGPYSFNNINRIDSKGYLSKDDFINWITYNGNCEDLSEDKKYNIIDKYYRNPY
ncbi:hypothetical protein P5F41_15660 [Clostridium perfringens]|nr:hypothetical protein [Clostridium perfringens]